MTIRTKLLLLLLVLALVPMGLLSVYFLDTTSELGMRLARMLKFISRVPKDQAETIMEALNINLGGRSGRVGSESENNSQGSAD